MSDQKPTIGIIMGDPAGIGPEIAAKSVLARETWSLCRPVVIGDARIVRAALAAENKDLPIQVLGT